MKSGWPTRNSTLEVTFQKAIEVLTRKGINPEYIETKSVQEPVPSVADCILTEARDEGYQTLVKGRCGHSSTAHFVLGSIASRIINRGAGLIICVVK